jgi:hypothetical protein
MAALVWGSGKCERLDIVESTSEICRVVAQRKGGVAFEAKFTMAEARNIKYGRENRILAEKDNYRNYGVDMLRARATARACRAVFPDILFGCYIPDEIEETIVPTEPRGPPKGEKRRGFARDLSETMPIEPAPKPAEVVVDRSTSQEVVEESNGEVESTTVAEINGETKVKIVDTSTVAELLDADKARRAELIGFITEGSKKFNPEEIEAIFAEAKVSFDIESYDVLSTPQLVALSNSQTIAMARKIAPTMKASALPQPAAKEPEESTLMRDCRIIGLARRENPETFRKAFDKLKYDPKMPASTLSKVQRDAVIREIYGDKPPL